MCSHTRFAIARVRLCKKVKTPSSSCTSSLGNVWFVASTRCDRSAIDCLKCTPSWFTFVTRILFWGLCVILSSTGKLRLGDQDKSAMSEEKNAGRVEDLR
jgi:hypothetical protein